MCRNSAWEAYQTAMKQNQASLPLGFTPIKVPCAGKVDPDYLLQAFTAGADGVLVLSCPQDNCKSSHGNRFAEWGVEQVQTLLAEAGIDPGRLLFHSLAANAPRDLIDAVDQLLANLRRKIRGNGRRLSFLADDREQLHPASHRRQDAALLRSPPGGPRGLHRNQFPGCPGSGGSVGRTDQV